MNLFDRFREFMRGRYGIDDLSKFLIYVCLVLFVLRILTANHIIHALSVVILIIIVVRFISHDIYIRQKENVKYLEYRDKVLDYIDLQKDKWRNRKTHVYRKCPYCKANIKLPRKPGKHVCCCPRCKRDFKVRVIH